eukprot:scaffold73381_cov61-Phaeocystis_antarctica.AAC.5
MPSTSQLASSAAMAAMQPAADSCAEGDSSPTPGERDAAGELQDVPAVSASPLSSIVARPTALCAQGDRHRTRRGQSKTSASLANMRSASPSALAGTSCGPIPGAPLPKTNDPSIQAVAAHGRRGPRASPQRRTRQVRLLHRLPPPNRHRHRQGEDGRGIGRTVPPAEEEQALAGDQVR